MANDTVDITGMPDKIPTSLQLNVTYNRSVINTKATWKLPKNATDKKKNANRYQNILYETYFDTNQQATKVKKTKVATPVKMDKAKKVTKKTKTKTTVSRTATGTDTSKKKSKPIRMNPTSEVQEGKPSRTEFVFKGKDGKGVSLKNYFPYTNAKLDAIVFRIQGKNVKSAPYQKKPKWIVVRKVVKKGKKTTTTYPSADGKQYTAAWVKTNWDSKSAKDKKALKKAKKFKVVTKGKNKGTVKYSPEGKLSFYDRVPTATAVQNISVPVNAVVSASNYTQNTRFNLIKIVCKDDGKGKIFSRVDYHLHVWKYDKEKTLKEFVNEKRSSTTLETNAYRFALASSKYKDPAFKPGDASDYIFPGEAIKMEVTGVVAKGPQGPACSDKDAKKGSFLFAYPKAAYNVKVDRSGNQVVIQFDLDSAGSTYRTDHLKLQRNKGFMIGTDKLLRADNAAWVAAVKQDVDGWEDVSDEVNHTVRAFSRASALDEPGVENPFARTYYRIKSYNDVFPEGEVFEFSEPQVLSGYSQVATAKDEKVEFLELVPESDGKSVRITVGYKHATVTKKTNKQKTDEDGKPVVDEEGNPVMEEVEEDDPASDSDGTEISWSENPNSWKSNEEPNTFDMPDETQWGTKAFQDAEPNYCGAPQERIDQVLSKEYPLTSTGYVLGLTEGSKYYFKARRYLEESGDLPRTYGDYTDYAGDVAFGDRGEAAKVVEPTTRPESVTAKVADALAIGKNLDVSWTFDAEGTQSEWQITLYKSSEITSKPDPDDPTKTVYEIAEGAVGTRFASGKDASGYAVLQYASVYDENGNATTDGLDQHLDENGIAYITVGVATTGDMTHSDPVRVRYVTPPRAALGIWAPPSEDSVPVLTAKPLRLTLGTNDQNTSATLRISSTKFTSLQYPDGLTGQPDDTVVFSRKISATDLGWQPVPNVAGMYYSNYQVPVDVPLHDAQEYEISLVVTNEEYDLNSMLEDSSGNGTPLTQRFSVNYAKRPYPPSRLSTYVRTVDENLPDFSAAITVGKDEQVQVGDVCDIYRVTPDGAYLVASDVSFGQTVVDNYAPFSNYALTRYRIAMRTPDGLVEWDDFGYNINAGRTDRPNYPIRFDWGLPEPAKDIYNSLEIPYNLDYSDTFTKLFEGRRHFGDKRPTGYWNDGADRTSSFTTDIIKYENPEEKEALRQLAQYAGPVMVRRPDGCAYVADVQVNNLSNSYSSLVVNVQFTVTEIEMVQDYMLSDSESLTNEEDKTYLQNLDTAPENFQSSPLYTPAWQVDPIPVPTES